jgi:hypothetical protein
MLVLVSFLALAYLFGIPASAQENTIECQSSTKEGREGQTLSVGPFHFTWLSCWSLNKITGQQRASQGVTAAGGQGVTYSICRGIHNDSSNNALYYSWPLAGNLRNEGLRAGTSDKICFLAHDYAKPTARGTLFYGRRGFETTTQVWQSVNEREQADNSRPEMPIWPVPIVRVVDCCRENDPSVPGKSDFPPIRVTLETHSVVLRPQQYLFFLPLPRKKERVDVHLLVSSVVERTVDGYSIRNTVVNLNPDTAINARFVMLSSTHPSAARGGSPLRAGIRRVDLVFFRNRLWPMPEDAPEPNHYQEFVLPEELALTSEPPALHSVAVSIRSPRKSPVVSFTFPVWVEHETTSAMQLP